MKDRLADLTARTTYVEENVAVPIDNDAFMEEFFQQVEVVRGLIEKVSSQVEEVKKKHSMILSAPNPDEKTKEELEKLISEIKKNAKSVWAKLTSMQQSLPEDENANRASCRIQRSQHTVLSRRFVEVMTEYNDAQLSFRQRSKSRIQRQLEITGRVTSNEDLEDMLESGNPSIFTSDIISDSKITRQALNEIEARHKDIIRLENSIKELHEMFVDMAMLVKTQGEMINNIEKNVTNTAEYVVQATESTKKAVRYQSTVRRKNIYLAILAVVIIIVIIIILAATLGK
ncbi:syntaxin-2 isoform X2 [Brienomyrus brachyistius]|uniref:syntaxin-2 isoform X2 n=1 Tax=Brienomyrus brachyistius TaxID=42636 RepID=UPI0020B1D0D6|nr:syntaxin-2 isoform X2 [Brienomyrus brachyistius]